AQGPDERCYRTGDLGRRLQDGSIEFIGRLDDQFKLNGVRLEPAEIEAHVEACPGIRRAAVAIQGRTSTDPRLVAYVVAESDADLPRIRRLLEPRLPAVMIPKTLIRVESLPLTPSGKLDRRALVDTVSNEVPEARRSAPPRDEIERRLLTIWQKVLGCPALGVDDNFFDVGGDSLASMQLLLTVEQEFGLWLDVDAFESLRSAADMAVHVRRQMAQRQTGRPEAPTTFDETLRKQKAYVGAWIGRRHAKGSLIVTLNATGWRRGLFWCLQSYDELTQLAAALGPDQPVHGMRSGDLVMSYTPNTVAALADHYAQEMVELQPEGPIQIGGNCQGSTIARATALTLRGMDRKVSRLILMEQGSFWPYDEPVALIFGRDSYLNPYRRLPDPNAVFRDAYR
ncbi:MAG: phosphopantetheine-binding protein, partial [Terriglobia bacterium]